LSTKSDHHLTLEGRRHSIDGHNEHNKAVNDVVVAKIAEG